MDVAPSRKFKNTWRISGLFLSALVGAGFATGREIFIYFAAFGVWGLAGFLLSCGILCVTSVCILSRRKLSPVIQVVIRVFTFLGYITMVAGFRDVLTLLFPDVAACHPVLFGVASCGIISAFTLLVLCRGFKFFATLCQIITPFLIICILTLSFLSIYKYGVPTLRLAEPLQVGTFSARVFLYTGYNILFLVGVLGRVDHTLGKMEIVGGSFLGTFLFLIGGAGIFIMLIQNTELLSQSAMPLCTLAQSWGPVLGCGFQVMVALAMLLCGVSALGSASGGGANRHFTGKILILLAIPLSYVGFDRILLFIYPIFGVMGIFLLCTLAKTHKKNV